jgi:hypothetical protein
MTPEAAETVALQALAYVVGEAAARERFLALSGAEPALLRTEAGNAAFLAGVLDFVLADEALLVAFCDAAEIAPETPQHARACLPGAAPAD